MPHTRQAVSHQPQRCSAPGPWRFPRVLCCPKSTGLRDVHGPGTLRVTGFERPAGHAVTHRLADLIETIRKDIPVYGELAAYQEWSRTAARFSFETYDLFLSASADHQSTNSG
jgi:hypothetical protein